VDSGDEPEKETLRDIACSLTAPCQSPEDSKSRLQGLLTDSPADSSESKPAQRLTLPITILPSSTPLLVVPKGGVGRIGGIGGLVSQNGQNQRGHNGQNGQQHESGTGSGSGSGSGLGLSVSQEDSINQSRKPRKGTPIKIPDSSSVTAEDEQTSPGIMVISDDGGDGFFTETEMMAGAGGNGSLGGLGGLGGHGTKGVSEETDLGVVAKAQGVGVMEKAAVPEIRASRTPILAPRCNQKIGGPTTSTTEILDLSAKKSPSPSPSPAPDSTPEAPPTHPQILLLNGKEYEIVSLGQGRWISRNEYELMHGLRSTGVGAGRGTSVAGSGTGRRRGTSAVDDSAVAASPDSTGAEHKGMETARAGSKRKLSTSDDEATPGKRSPRPQSPPLSSPLDLTSKTSTSSGATSNIKSPTQTSPQPVNLSGRGSERDGITSEKGAEGSVSLRREESIARVKQLAEAVAAGDMNGRQALLAELLKLPASSSCMSA
jgi:hypothetical protein